MLPANSLPTQNYFKVVDNIFNKEGMQSLGEWCKSLPGMETQGSTQILYRLSQVSIRFSDTHQICKGQKWSDLNPSKLVQMNDCALIKALFVSLISRLGNEQKLVGSHTINFSVKRLHLEKNEGKSEAWHSDKGTHLIMISLLQNDFHFVDGKGLNIAIHEAKGSMPLSQNIYSIEYPDGGGILIENKNGKVIHQRSSVKAIRTHCTQTIAQIEILYK